MKKRLCCGCKERYPVDEGMILPAGFFHSMDCVTEYSTNKVRKQREKELKRKVKEDKQKHTKAKKELKDNDRSFQLKKTQQIFNKYIRVRDSNYPCISCSRFHDGQYHAGHYRSVGSSPELRFDERNCHKQCSACNNHLSGNIVQYRSGLLHRYSSELVAFIEGHHEAKRYTIDQLKIIQRWFTRKTKRLIKEQGND